jgi:hypothetical protein
MRSIRVAPQHATEPQHGAEPVLAH